MVDYLAPAAAPAQPAPRAPIDYLAPRPAGQPMDLRGAPNQPIDLLANQRPAAQVLDNLAWWEQAHPGEPAPSDTFNRRQQEDPAGLEAYLDWRQTPEAQDQAYAGERGPTIEEQGGAPAGVLQTLFPQMGRGLEIGLQGVGRGLSNVAGAPGDLGNMIGNLGIHGFNQLTGADAPLSPASPIGSQAIRDIATPVAEAVGLPVREDNELNAGERMMLDVTDFGTQAAVGGAGLARMALTRGAAAAAPAVAGSPSEAFLSTGVGRALTTPYTQAPGATLARDSIAGAGAGVGNFLYDENAPEWVQNHPVLGPLGNMLAVIGGGTGGHLLGGVTEAAAGGAAGAARNAAGGRYATDLPPNSETGASYRRSDVADAAAILQGRARNSMGEGPDMRQASNEIAAAQNRLASVVGPTSMPTAGLLSNNPGVIGFENLVRARDPIPFITRDNAVREAAAGQIDNVAPEGATGRQFTDAAEGIQDQRVAEAQNIAAPYNVPPDQLPNAAAAIDDAVVEGTLKPMQQASSQRFGQVDPDRTAQIDVSSTQELARKIVDDLGQLADPRTVLPAGLLARVLGPKGTPETVRPVQATMEMPVPGGSPRMAADGAGGFAPETNQPVLDPRNPYPQGRQTVDVDATVTTPGTPPTVSVGEIVEVWPEMSRAIDRARKAENYNLADNLQALRAQFGQILTDAAANGDAAAQRALKAQEGWQQTLGANFGRPGTAGRRLRQDYNLDRTNRGFAPPSQTAGRFLQRGQPERATELKQILESSANPAAGEQAVYDYLMADLARAGAVQNGVLRPDVLAKWRNQWGPALAVSPKVQRALDATFQELDQGASSRGAVFQSVEQARRAIANPAANQGALGFVLGNDPVNAIGAVFKSGDPERAMGELIATVGTNGAAMDGLKAAVREYLWDRATTTAVNTTTSGRRPASFAKLDQLLQENTAALSQVFSPDEMHALQSAYNLLRPLANRANQALPGSGTAERVFGGPLGRTIELALRAKYGHLAGGGMMRTLRLAAQQIVGANTELEHLMTQMFFDPDLLRHLLDTPIDQINTPSWNSRLNKLMGVLAGARAEPATEDAEPDVDLSSM